MLVVKRCKTMAQLEQVRRSPLLLSVTTFGIGVMASTSIMLLFQSGGFSAILSSQKDSGHVAFGLFAGGLSFYHLAEFASVAYYNPHILNIDSLLVNQVGLCLSVCLLIHISMRR